MKVIEGKLVRNDEDEGNEKELLKGDENKLDERKEFKVSLGKSFEEPQEVIKSEYDAKNLPRRHPKPNPIRKSLDTM